jgi:futalosine hydrolase
MKPILVQAAVPRELELLASMLEGRRSVGRGLYPATEGFLGDASLVCCAGGVGKANAAASATYLLEQYRPSLMIITGCGGAYPGSGLAVGDLAVASDELFADEGTETLGGWLDLQAMQLPLYTQQNRQYYNTIPLSRHAAEKAMQLADTHGVRLTRGRFLTVSACSGTRARGLELRRRHQAICENMEGASCALVALRYGVPCLEIRGISNLVEDRDLSRWDLLLAMEAAQRFVIKVVEDLQRSSLSGEPIILTETEEIDKDDAA